MRISDWSSDVCSSDLGGPARPCRRRRTRPEARRPARRERPCRWSGGRSECRAPARSSCGRPVPPRPGDRKSVVEGKSVSVRVDLGGGRIIKKQSRETMTEDIKIKTKRDTRKKL